MKTAHSGRCMAALATFALLASPLSTPLAHAEDAAPAPAASPAVSAPAAEKATAPAADGKWKSRPTENPPRVLVKKGEIPKEITPESPEETLGYGKTRGVAGEFLFGPSITLLGFPSPFKINLESKWQNLIGAQFSYGFLPTLKFSGVSGKLNSWDVRARIYPFRGAFFIGAAYGKQTVNASKLENITVAGTAYATTVNGELNNSFFAPHIGWRWTWKSGFFYGMDLGWQLQSGSRTAITYVSDAPAAVTSQLEQQAEFINLRADVQKTANDLGDKGIPLFTLIQIGWLF